MQVRAQGDGNAGGLVTLSQRLDAIRLYISEEDWGRALQEATELRDELAERAG